MFEQVQHTTPPAGVDGPPVSAGALALDTT